VGVREAERKKSFYAVFRIRTGLDQEPSRQKLPQKRKVKKLPAFNWGMFFLKG
jgi:hypothetical protein